MKTYQLASPALPSPAWFNHVSQGQHGAEVAADGATVWLDGEALRLCDGASLLPGTAVRAWLGSRFFVCATLEEIEREAQARCEATAAEAERHRKKLIAMRAEAEEFNARLVLPVAWDVGIKDVLSGLSESSWGDGRSRATGRAHPAARVAGSRAAAARGWRPAVHRRGRQRQQRAPLAGRQARAIHGRRRAALSAARDVPGVPAAGCALDNGADRLMLHIHAPRTSAVCAVNDCPTCARPRRMLGLCAEWYGTTWTCTGCGDQWSDGERLERPFRRGWRQAQVRRARQRLAAVGVNA